MMEAPADFQIPVPHKRGSGKLSGSKKVIWRLAVPQETELTQLGDEEGIGMAFGADGGGGAVAGVDDGAVG
jgi:hypothetical protein